MSGAGVFDPKAFLQARSQGRSAPPAPPPRPASPQILGVDSDDDFSNLNSSFATLGDVPSLSPDNDSHASSRSPEVRRGSSRPQSPEKKSSPVRQQLSPLPDEPSDADVKPVVLPPGHIGHQVPDEVVQNQLFTGYGVPQRMPSSIGRRMGPSAVHRPPPAIQPPSSLPRPATPNQDIPANQRPPSSAQPSSSMPRAVHAPHNLPVGPAQHGRVVRPPPRPPIGPNITLQPEAIPGPAGVHRGPVRRPPPRPLVSPSPVSGPETNDPGFVHHDAVRPSPRPMVQPPIRQPMPSTRLGQPPIRTRLPPEPVRPGILRPSVMPRPMREPASAAATPSEPAVRARPPSEPVRPGVLRPPVMPRPMPQPVATAALPLDQIPAVSDPSPVLARGNIPHDSRAPRPIRPYRTEPPRRPVPPPYRSNSAAPSRPPPAQFVAPLQQQQSDNGSLQQPPLDSTRDASFDSCRSPSPLLLPPQRRSHGIPPVYRRIVEQPSEPVNSPSVVFMQPVQDLSNQQGPERSPSPLSIENTAASSPTPAAQGGFVQSSPKQLSVTCKRQSPSRSPPVRDNLLPAVTNEIAPSPSADSVSSQGLRQHTSRSSSRSASRSPSAALSPRAAVIATPNIRPDQQTRSRFRSPEPESAENNGDRPTESNSSWFERTSHRLSPPGSIAGSITDERRQYFIQKAKLVQQRHQEEIDSLKQQIQKLKASLRALPAPATITQAESVITYDDCLPLAFNENSRLVRRALDEQLDNNARLEAMLSKVAFVLESGSYPDSFQSMIEKAFESREMKLAQDKLVSAENRINELVHENDHLSKQLAAKEERIKAVQEESRVLIETLRQSLEQETFERKRMNALYDEERHVLNASLRETMQKLAADNERYRVRLLEAGLSDD